MKKLLFFTFLLLIVNPAGVASGSPVVAQRSGVQEPRERSGNVQCSILNVRGETRWLNPLDTLTGANYVCGRWWSEELKTNYHRLPDRAQQEVRSAVWGLSKQSAGLSIKFHSNAPSIRVRYQVTGGLNMFHMPTTGVSGLDLYATDANGELRWCASRFNLSFKDTINYEFRHITYFTGERRGYDYELFLPLYNEVKWLEIGVDDGYDLRLTPVTQEAPIVVYGTSIGQGACASRTGMAWTNIVKRETGYPLINLAFSGNGMLEEEVFRYLNEIDAKLYILDCLPNLTEDKVPLIYDRMVRGVEMLRAEHPDVPILLVEHHYANASSSQRAIDRYADSNAEQLRAYDTLLARGFTNLYYLSHRELAFTQESMVEGIHPNDIGMRQYADAYIRKINNIFQTQKITHSIFHPRTQQRDPYNWHERHEQILQANCLQAPQIVMIGNSITHYWTDDRPASDVKDYRASWDKLFRGRIARNLGFGFDRIENGLWRVMHGELDGYSADKIFLLLGTNNLSTNTDEEIVEGMLLLIQAVRHHQPKARIYQCGIMPRRGELQRVNHINALLQERLAGQESRVESQESRVESQESNFKYIDLSSGLVDDNGNLIESLFSDGLHPNARGYEIVARNLERYVKE